MMFSFHGSIEVIAEMQNRKADKEEEAWCGDSFKESRILMIANLLT